MQNQTSAEPAASSPPATSAVREALARINSPTAGSAVSPFLTVDETAGLLRVSRETFRRMVHQRRLAALVLGSGGQAQIRVPRAFVDRVLAEVEAGRTVVMAEFTAAWNAEQGVPPQAA